jgi:hypothetical protein
VFHEPGDKGPVRQRDSGDAKGEISVAQSHWR